MLPFTPFKTKTEPASSIRTKSFFEKHWKEFLFSSGFLPGYWLLYLIGIALMIQGFQSNVTCGWALGLCWIAYCMWYKYKEISNDEKFDILCEKMALESEKNSKKMYKQEEKSEISRAETFILNLRKTGCDDVEIDSILKNLKKEQVIVAAL